VRGEIDLYPEYTGTALTAILEQEPASGQSDDIKIVTDTYSRRFDLVWLPPFGFDNTYTITVRKEDAERRDWWTISDLAGSAAGLRAGFTAEFAERPDGYPGLRRVYGLAFGSVRDMDPALMYQAMAKGEIDVICAFATDGRISAFDLKPLVDNRDFFPPYHAAPVIRGEILSRYPEVRQILEPLAGLLSDSAMQQLNFRVDQDKASPRNVARDFLISRNLIR
jgi:osmoprotectant transport system permease protein